MKQGMGDKGFIKSLLGLLLLAAVIFVGVSFGKPYYRYHTLTRRTTEAVEYQGGRISVPDLRAKIMADAAELGITTLTEENLRVTINEAKLIKVHATWSDTVDFWGYYQKQFDFVMNEEY